MASCGEERAAAIFATGVPAELAVPGPDSMVIVDLGVMDISEQALVEDCARAGELSGEAAFEADASSDSVLFGGLHDGFYFGERVGHGFLEDDVFAGAGGCDGLVSVSAWQAGDVDDVYLFIAEHAFEG